ncbi:MAG: CBS domain-containing protein [Marinifilaceae bacterium]|jgi:CBS domain-containing protein|nr:CBS domain-containing protein [Marinifilaceae bacterium]
MIAKDLLSDTVPVLRETDTGLDALNWMEISRISHLPIVRGTEFMGLISDTDIYDMNEAEKPIGNHCLSLYSPFVNEDTHIYNIIGLISSHKITAIPVLKGEKNYIGIITLNDIMKNIGQIFSEDVTGGIIVLQLNIIDYSLTEISQIIESDDAKILNLHLKTIPNSKRIEITIKINRTDISSIVQSFNRYGYKIKASYLTNDKTKDLMQERYNAFMRFLNT